MKSRLTAAAQGEKRASGNEPIFDKAEIPSWESRPFMKHTNRKLEGRVAIVTGAGSGIGRATAQLFSREGAKLAVVDRARKEAEETVRLIKNDDGDARMFEADVSVSSQIERVVKEVVSTYGRIDILVNNAGINPSGTLLTTSEALWTSVMSINVTSMFLFSKCVVPEMLKTGKGVIINMGSVNSFLANSNEVAYDASKGAVLMLTKAMALDLAPKIRVNAICPGVIETPMVRQIIADQKDPEGTRRALEATSLLGRLGRPEDVANVALFLASDDSEFVDGTAILVDGGWTAFGGNPAR
jgi:NAD(P)-dependent dehydrogenase (short-subunit alcohol dehydrogenase family)